MTKDEAEFIHGIVKRGWLDLYHERLIEIILRQHKQIEQLEGYDGPEKTANQYTERLSLS